MRASTSFTSASYSINCSVPGLPENAQPIVRDDHRTLAGPSPTAAPQGGPDGPGGRGSQISYAHTHAWPIMQALIAMSDQ